MKKLDVTKMTDYIRVEKLTRIADWLDGNAEEAAKRFHRYVVAGCRLSMPARGAAGGHRPAYWWNAEIAEKRKLCIAKRRAYQRRGRRNGDRDSEREEYNREKKELRSLIRKSQEKAWGELIARVEGDVWGMPFRLVTKKLARGPRNAYTRGKEEEIAKHLFPGAATTDWNEIALTGPHGFPIPLPDKVHTRPFDEAELARAAKRLPGEKAPGPDMIHNEVLKIFVREDPEAMLALFNRGWGASAFPTECKRARLVLLYKGGTRSPEDPASFRPISLVNTTAKLYERLVLYRLEAELSEHGGLSIKQFGFRRGVGTTDAISRALELAEEDPRNDNKGIRAIISLDVQNAFNTAAWTAIDEAIRKKGLSRHMVNTLRSYMENREILVKTAEGTTANLTVRAGVPQGSVLGPTLWNILYDGILRMDLPRGVDAVAYADDLVLVAVNRSAPELEEAAGTAIAGSVHGCGSGA